MSEACIPTGEAEARSPLMANTLPAQLLYLSCEIESVSPTAAALLRQAGLEVEEALGRGRAGPSGRRTKRR
jgi:hypothetical protein